MNYIRVRLMTGGTFTTGAGLDWSTQFDSASVTTCAIQTTAGEFDLGSVSCGVCADMCVNSNSPYSSSIYVEGGASSSTIQVNVNGVIQEISSGGPVTLNLDAGPNLVKFVCSKGPIVVLGPLYNGVNAEWQSLYSQGDPFSRSSGTGGSTTSTASVSATPITPL